MTNRQIISTYKALNGIEEELHTFAAWKSLGYQVKKGEKSAHKLAIWKRTVKQIKNEETGSQDEETNMFMRTASFFLASQVEKITSNSL